MAREEDIILKTAEEAGGVRRACALAAAALDHIAPHVQPGVSTAQLDEVCRAFIAARGARSAALNYAPPGHPPFPGAVCISVNHQVCHGIPSPDKILRDGDILNIDITVIKDGFYGDTGRMFAAGKPPVLARRLARVARECLWRAIEFARPGGRLGDIGAAVQQHAESERFSVVREFCGHGIGRNFHEPPQVLHYGRAKSGAELLPGMIFTIEPMINAGRRDVKVLSDGWTAVTRDRSLSAQWEHTVHITEDGCEVMTLSAQNDSEALPFAADN